MDPIAASGGLTRRALATQRANIPIPQDYHLVVRNLRNVRPSRTPTSGSISALRRYTRLGPSFRNIGNISGEGELLMAESSDVLDNIDLLYPVTPEPPLWLQAL